MPLQPGPFVQAPQSDVAVQPGVNDFTDDAVLWASGLQSTISGWDGFFADLYGLASDPLADLTDGSLGAIAAELGAETAAANLPDLDATLTLFTIAGNALTAANAFAPAEAFTDPPAPFIPPGNALNINPPLVPPNAFTPGLYVSSLQGAAGVPSVILVNNTRVGQVNFVVGDSFTVIGTGGTSGQLVTVDGLQNGYELGVSTIATLDGTGSFATQGTMGPANVGAWQENWYFDSVLIANLNFIVTSGNA